MSLISKSELESKYEVLQFFNATHLPNALANISKPCCDLAFEMAMKLEDSEQLRSGLDKLLEAKDCFVRAKLISDN